MLVFKEKSVVMILVFSCRQTEIDQFVGLKSVWK